MKTIKRICSGYFKKIFVFVYLIIFIISVLFTSSCQLFFRNNENVKSAKKYSSISERKTVPYTLPWDDMPIDLSFIYNDEKPAGKHGFLMVNGDNFVFEDGSIAKFWGTNFNCAQNFPSHEHSEKLAKRLAKVGINIVRFHQLDAEWSTPNIFQYTKGNYLPDTKNFNSESLDRLDYLIYCLKNEGIYIYMDLLTRRFFKTGDGIKDARKLAEATPQGAAKPYSTFNRDMIELQKKYASDLFNHVNPFTHLAYKNDPAIALVAITNENDVFSKNVTLEPYKTELQEMYKDWAEKNNIKLKKENVEFTQSDEDIRNFLIEITKKYYTEIIQDLRDIGVKIPIAGNNWSKGNAHLSAQMVADFTDNHGYWYSFKNNETGLYNWRKDHNEFLNDPMIGSSGAIMSKLAPNRVSGKPFFVSEWNNPWPNEWRAETSLLMAAVGALQGWGGFTIHTYRYSLEENVDMIGNPITSDALGGIYFRGGVFDSFNDPAIFGLFYHTSLILRRGDVSPAKKIVNIKVSDLATNSDNSFNFLIEKHKVATILPGMKGEGDIEIIPGEILVDEKNDEVLSDTEELYRNTGKKTGWIDTPKTKAVYGLVGKEGDIKLKNLKINVKTDFATVALSSLTDEPINKSSNILLTSVGRTDNSDSKYNPEHTVQLDRGHGPVLIEIIEAMIEIDTNRTNLRVMAINNRGGIIGYLPSEYKEGKFCFEIGKEYYSMYYLIQDL